MKRSTEKALRRSVLKFNEFKRSEMSTTLRSRNIAAVVLNISRDFDVDLACTYFCMQGCSELEEALVRGYLVQLAADRNLRDVPYYCRLREEAA